MIPETYPVIVEFDGKNKKITYFVNSEEEFTKACYEVLKERLTADYVYMTVQDAEEAINFSIQSSVMSMSDDDAEFFTRALKITRTKEGNKFGELLWSAKQLERIMNLPPEEAITDTIEHEGKPINTVQQILIARADRRYEGYRLVEFRTVK